SLHLYVRNPQYDREIRGLAKSAYDAQRPGGGRLFGARHSKTIASSHQHDLGKAQVLLLNIPDSDNRQRLQNLVYLAAGDWRTFIDSTKKNPRLLDDPATLNNLGASYLALSDNDPS